VVKERDREKNQGPVVITETDSKANPLNGKICEASECHEGSSSDLFLDQYNSIRST
jgi:hypothetical protein